jgi:hypothetical protein
LLETVTGDSPAEAGAVSEHTPGALLMHIGLAPWTPCHSSNTT